jgi:hypothetical protein
MTFEKPSYHSVKCIRKVEHFFVAGDFFGGHCMEAQTVHTDNYTNCSDLFSSLKIHTVTREATPNFGVLSTIEIRNSTVPSTPELYECGGGVVCTVHTVQSYGFRALQYYHQPEQAPPHVSYLLARIWYLVSFREALISKLVSHSSYIVARGPSSFYGS